MNKKLLFILIATLVVVALAILYFALFQKNITGEAVLEDYSFTKAVCDEKTCQDYKVVCKDSEVVSFEPITGAVIEKSNDWNDPRTQEEIDRMCD